MPNINRYDLWKLDTPDNHVNEIGECLYCKGAVYGEEHHVFLEVGLCHSECLWAEEQEKHYEELES